MPDLTGQTEEYARTFGYNNGITINVNYVEGSIGQIEGTIVNQSVPFRTDLEYVNSITIDVLTIPDYPIIEEPLLPEITPEIPIEPEVEPEV